MSTQPKSDSPFQNRLLVIVATCLAIAAFVLNFFYINQIIRDQRRGAFRVARASDDLKDGSVIDSGDVTFVEVPGVFETDMRNVAVREDEFRQIVGSPINRSVTRGSLLLWEYFGGAQGNNPQLRIDPRYRAVTIQIDSAATPTALLQPGGYVDLIGEVRLDAGAQATTMTILERVEVLATGTDLLPENPDDPRSRRRARSFRDITIKLRPEDGVRIRAIESRMDKRQFIVHARNPSDDTLVLPRGKFNPMLEPLLRGVGDDVTP